MASSMSRGGRSCPGDALEGLAWFRRGLYACLWRRPDSLFELADAVLGAPGPVASLPYLSLEPAFRRGHGMVYQGLAEGGIDEEALRDLLVAARPRDWPLVFAIDASTYPRPGAETSPDREFHHHSCAGSHGENAVAAGWAFQWLSQLSFAHDSWTAPQDQARVGSGDDPTRQAALQVMAHSERLRAAGETGIPLYVLDAGYDEAALTWDLRRRLDGVQVLVRIRNDRVLYRDPPPRARGEPHPRPPARVQGPGHLGCPGPGTQAGRGEVRAGHRAVLGRAAPGADPQGPVRRPRQAAPGQVPPHPRDRHPAPGRTQGPRPAMAVVGRPRHPRPGPHLARLPAPLRHRDGLYATGKKGGVALWGRSAGRSGSRPGRR